MTQLAGYKKRKNVFTSSLYSFLLKPTSCYIPRPYLRVDPIHPCAAVPSSNENRRVSSNACSRYTAKRRHRLACRIVSWRWKRKHGIDRPWDSPAFKLYADRDNWPLLANTTIPSSSSSPLVNETRPTIMLRSTLISRSSFLEDK